MITEMMINKNKNKENGGFTIVETLVYVAIFGILIGSIFNMLLYVYGTNKKITDYTNVTLNAQSAMERISYEVTNAKNIYVPTSNFENYNYVSGKSGQLSLSTNIYATANDELTFMDFYVENGTLFLKMDGYDPMPLTSASVTVSTFGVYYYQNGSRESVKIDLAVQSKSNSESSINLLSTVTIR